MKKIQKAFNIKDDKKEPPDIYLGVTLSKMKLDNGKYCWTILLEQYVKAAVINVEKDIARSGKRFPSRCVTPLLSNFAPWLEDYLELMVDGVQQYQELIDQVR